MRQQAQATKQATGAKSAAKPSPLRTAPLSNRASAQPSSQQAVPRTGRPGGIAFDFGQVSAGPIRREQPPAHEIARGGFAGSSTPLPYRSEMEQRFGRDFSSVQAFTGAQARGANATLGAEAYTVGRRIAFGSAKPDRGTVAHELAHVVQQEGGTARDMAMKSGRTPASSSPELEAQSVERAVLAGQPLPVISGQHPGVIAKKTTPEEPAEVTAALNRLANVKNFPDVVDILGAVFGFLAPAPKTSASAEFKVRFNFPVGSIPVQIGFGFEVTVEQTSNGSMKLGGVINGTAGVGADFGIEDWGQIHAHLVARFALGVDASGDNGAECMRLIGLVIDHELRKHTIGFGPYTIGGEEIADKVFGRSYAEGVVAAMDFDDKNTTTDDANVDKVEYFSEFGIEANAKLESSAMEPVAGKKEGEVTLHIGKRDKTELASSGKNAKKLSATDTEGYYMKIELAVGGVKVTVAGFDGHKQDKSTRPPKDSPVRELELVAEVPITDKEGSTENRDIATYAAVSWDAFSRAFDAALGDKGITFEEKVENALKDSVKTSLRNSAIFLLKKTWQPTPSLEFKLKYSNEEGLSLIVSSNRQKEFDPKKFKPGSRVGATMERKFGFKSVLFTIDKNISELPSKFSGK